MPDDRLFWIDTDTASDDAVAILMALRWPGVNVLGISIVSGNMPVSQGSINARYTVELCAKETPVYEGCISPLLRPVHHAHWFHGPDGMGDMHYPMPLRPPAPGRAVGEILSTFQNQPGEIELVTLGPLTNIAAALIIEPRLAKWVKKCTIMGGAACTAGNVTPAAEYNIWCDPEAAAIVLKSGMEIQLVGWELARLDAELDAADISRIQSLKTSLGDFVIDCNRFAHKVNVEKFNGRGITLPDPVTMAVALDPLVATRVSRHYVEISIDDGPTRGMTVVDQWNTTGEPANAAVTWEIDVTRWKQDLLSTLV